MSTANNKQINLEYADSLHQVLNIDLLKVFAFGIVTTIGIYGGILLTGSSYLIDLLYNRGFTQYLVIFLASCVSVFICFKFRKIYAERKLLTKEIIPARTAFINHNSYEIASLQKSLAQAKSLLAIRCSRVIASYITTGDRQTVADFITDDSSFFTAASASSYVLPRIVVWAIPLLGFIGTVVGISSAVNGFSSFLSSAEEIEQIKEGIGLVTSGLAVAFDTTLLALLLSVLVMLPLVAVERLESQLLLSVDIYLNDRILSKLKNKELETQAAANSPTEKMVEEVSRVQQINSQLLKQIELTTSALEQQASVVERLQQNVQTDSSSKSSTSSQLDFVLERVNHNLSQLEPILRELNLPRRLVLVEEKNKES
ncbi:MotA/TolQ/ExbB proton channel family protein [Myxosarcina sp. GI1]|uniref:MotA/TolQ/ExbB proton channel family protein n=1 Tax=Myxosarcina sp. GI1 TaxID=1541065 RepID=UPI00068EB4AC|nr:MotA/TolQ/ExbB proton channel family protein [Myxosarcina sp. GI1]